MANATTDSYEIVTGLHYKTAKGEKRAEPGDVVDDLPTHSVKWLLADGHIKKPKAKRGA